MKKQSMLLLFSFGFSWMLMAQNVGIGTIAPSEKLQVAGNIKADTLKLNGIKILPNAGIGKILTSDKDGNGIWQTNMSPGNSGFGVWGDCATNGNITEYFPVADSAGAAGDQFGSSTAISGNYAIVGANSDDIGSNTDQGSASIYFFNGLGWVLQQKIVDAAGAANDRFGFSVAIAGNYAIVGSVYDSDIAGANQGSVSIYMLEAGEWKFKQKLLDASGASGDYFGYSVSMTEHFLLIGAPMDNVGANADQGSVSFYKLNGGTWQFQQKLTDLAGGSDRYGISVAMHANNAIVGAFLDDVGANVDQGSALVYMYDGINWVYNVKVVDPSGASSDIFGIKVAISDNYAVVGSTSDDVSANTNQGSATLFKFNGVSWLYTQKLYDYPGTTEDAFGYSVCVSENFVMVGKFGGDVSGMADQGTVVIFQRVGAIWQKLQIVADPAGLTGNNFCFCAFDEVSKRFVIGAPGTAGSIGKVVFGKVY